jgi:glycerol-3-phosphate acyltransferase PlsY
MGCAAALLVSRYLPDGWLALRCGHAVLGHMYPVWLRFRGRVFTGVGLCPWLRGRPRQVVVFALTSQQLATSPSVPSRAP